MVQHIEPTNKLCCWLNRIHKNKVTNYYTISLNIPGTNAKLHCSPSCPAGVLDDHALSRLTPWSDDHYNVINAYLLWWRHISLDTWLAIPLDCWHRTDIHKVNQSRTQCTSSTGQCSEHITRQKNHVDANVLIEQLWT